MTNRAKWFGVWGLILSLLGPFTYANNLISLEEYRSKQKKRCASLLNLGPRVEGKEADILKFEKRVSLNSKNRVQLSPMFEVINLTAQNVRGLESHLQNHAYASPQLIVGEPGITSLKYRLIEYVNTWSPINYHEEAIQEFIKTFIMTQAESSEEIRLVELFLPALRDELLTHYSEEQVGSVIFSVDPKPLY